jgi:hypothetical protein
MKNTDFELNVIKLGIHIFQLQKGDRFESNGSYFNYVPSAPENMGKGTRSRWYGRSNNISAKKYEKDVLRADNIKLIENKLIGFKTEEEAAAEEELRKAEGWKASRVKVWEVQYAYKIEKEEKEKLLLLLIKQEQKRFNEPYEWVYEQHQLEVQRETDKLLFLKKSMPITYHSKIEKTDLDNVHFHYDVNFMLCYMDDKFHENEAKLFAAVQKWKEDQIQSAKAKMEKETENLSKFQKLKQKHSY